MDRIPNGILPLVNTKWQCHSLETDCKRDLVFHFQEVSELSNNLVEQSIEHEKRSKEFESNLRELQLQLRNAKEELDRQATNLQDLLRERDNRLKVDAKRGQAAKMLNGAWNNKRMQKLTWDSLIRLNFCKSNCGLKLSISMEILTQFC